MCENSSGGAFLTDDLVFSVLHYNTKFIQKTLKLRLDAIFPGTENEG